MLLCLSICLFIVSCAQCRVAEINQVTIDEITLPKDHVEKTNEVHSPIDNKPHIIENNNSDNLVIEAHDDAINEIDSNDPKPIENEVIDNGTALILTPLIKSGYIEEARKQSEVDPKLFLGFKSHSGFLTVNETYNSNLFFWYFPKEGKPANETPLIVWLQGGPGVSSFTGLFDEIGPIMVDLNGEMSARQYTWLQNHSLLFIDNPVGTGYSFTDHPDGYATDMDTYATHLFIAIKQLMQLFPELRTSPMYLCGESYAGKYVPAMAYKIHQHRNDEDFHVNLQGLIVGNGLIQPEMVTEMTKPFYYFGLLGHNQVEIIKPLLEAFKDDVANNRSVAAKRKWSSLIVITLFLTHQHHAYNFLKDDIALGQYVSVLKRSEIKRAIHVGDIRYSVINVTVNTKLEGDFLSSTKSMFEELLEHYRAMVYCGHLDQMLPCVVTSEIYRTWEWSHADDFRNSTRYPYIFNNKLAGYHRTGGHLTEVIVRSAGHMVPLDVPAPTQALIARWTHNKTLSRRYGIFDGSFVQDFVKNNSNVLYF